MRPIRAADHEHELLLVRLDVGRRLGARGDVVLRLVGRAGEVPAQVRVLLGNRARALRFCVPTGERRRRRRRDARGVGRARTVRPVADVVAVERGVARTAEQGRAQPVREQHRLLEPRQVVADPRTDQHQRSRRPPRRCRTSWSRRVRSRARSTSGTASSGIRISSSARPSTASASAPPSCQVPRHRRLLSEPQHREHCEHDRERGRGLREQRRVVEPEVRVRRRQHCRDEPGPIAGQPAAEQPDEADRGRSQQARHQPVPQRTLHPDERPRGQIGDVQRRVGGARELQPRELVAQRVEKALAVCKDVRPVVVRDRVSPNRRVAFGDQHVRHPPHEPEHHDHDQPRPETRVHHPAEAPAESVRTDPGSVSHARIMMETSIRTSPVPSGGAGARCRMCAFPTRCRWSNSRPRSRNWPATWQPPSAAGCYSSPSTTAAQGYEQWGCRTCAQWLSWHCGLDIRAAQERVPRRARARGVAVVTAEFAAGGSAISKVRAMTRVATPENEEKLITLATHTTAVQVERAVRAYRSISPGDTRDRRGEHASRGALPALRLGRRRFARRAFPDTSGDGRDRS